MEILNNQIHRAITFIIQDTKNGFKSILTFQTFGNIQNLSNHLLNNEKKMSKMKYLRLRNKKCDMSYNVVLNSDRFHDSCTYSFYRI